MNEDFYARCSRCDAIVAVQDITSCGYHETDCLCQFCWKDHWMRHTSDTADVTKSLCWAEQVMLTPSERWLRRTRPGQGATGRSV